MGPVKAGMKRGADKENNKKAKKQKLQKKSLSKKQAKDEEDSRSEESEELEYEVNEFKELNGDEDDELDELSENEADELDDLSENEEIEDPGTSDAEDGETSPNGASGERTSSKEQHQEQKKLLAERKLHRKSGVQVQKIKSLWEKLRIKKPTPPKAVRDKLSDEIWNLSKDCILDLVMKHDASRVVQTLVKYSSKQRREAIANSLKGNYYQLATSSYGKYLLVKLLHYGSKDTRNLIIDELHGKLRKLMRHKEGAYVAEDLFVLYASSKQKQQMIREFWGSSFAIFRNSGEDKGVLEVCSELVERKQLIMKNLYGTIKASVEKGSTGFQILHAAMKDYTTILKNDVDQYDSQIREFVDLLSEQFAELVHTQEGSEVACSLIAMANAKERKLIVRDLKSHSTELVKNEHGNAVLICLFMTVDDTVLLAKAFINELVTKDLFANFISDKYARRPFLYLMNGLDVRFVSPLLKHQLLGYEELAYKKTTKKPQSQRRQELLEKALPLMYKSLLSFASGDEGSNRFRDILSNNLASQFIGILIMSHSEANEINSDFRPRLINLVFDNCVKGDILEDFHLINKVPFISRMLKSIIQGNDFLWDKENKKLIRMEKNQIIPGTGIEFGSRLAEYILKENALKDWISGQGMFVVLNLYETLQDLQESPVSGQFKAELKKHVKTLEDNTDNRSALLLKNMIL